VTARVDLESERAYGLVNSALRRLERSGTGDARDARGADGMLAPP
jgi:hypothetical protein